MPWRVNVESLEGRRCSGSWASIEGVGSVQAATHTLVLGASESGKTALAFALAGVGRGRIWRGKVEWSGELDCPRAGMIPSSPDLVFSGLCSTVGEEIALGAQPLGQHGVSEIIEGLALRPLLPRDPFSLSGGQRTLAGIAALAVGPFPLLVMDQAGEWLDEQNRVRVLALLRSQVAGGRAVVELAARLPLSAEPGVWLGRKPEADLDSLRDLPKTKLGDPVLCVSNLSYAYPDRGFALQPVTMEVRAGSRIAVTGPNGAGKTTLLRSIAQLVGPAQGTMRVRGPAGAWETSAGLPHHEWARQVRYVAQNPDDQLYQATVRDELGREGVRSRVVRAFGLEEHLSRSPFDLPRSLRRLLSVGIGLVAEPSVLLLDEPTAWLDANQVVSLALEVADFCARGGAVMFISHDAEFSSAFATSHLVVDSGVVRHFADSDGSTTG